MWGFLAVTVLLVGYGVCSELKSPCPGVFEYTRQNEKGQYDAEITVQSDYTLHGVWIRLFFDQAPKDVKILDGFGEVFPLDTNPTSILIKNRDYVLKKKQPLKVKFTLKYDGDSPPALTGYRLNARELCPPEQD